MIKGKSSNQKKEKKSIEPNSERYRIWESIAKNYDMIQGAQLSNSLIILMALSESKDPLNTTQISQIIALNTKGQIYKISATLKDSLEHRLKREGYVEGVNLPNKSLYSITPKGKRLLKGWIGFLSAYV
jgi:siroheme synthase (precorrin-2 oxidase/ferrochelatase)